MAWRQILTILSKPKRGGGLTNIDKQAATAAADEAAQSETQ